MSWSPGKPTTWPTERPWWRTSTTALTDDETWVIGGAQIYALALPLADPM